ncbi:hypothetical protein Tcan_00546, partial [Toxocara canis]
DVLHFLWLRPIHNDKRNELKEGKFTHPFTSRDNDNKREVDKRTNANDTTERFVKNTMEHGIVSSDSFARTTKTIYEYNPLMCYIKKMSRQQFSLSHLIDLYQTRRSWSPQKLRATISPLLLHKLTLPASRT